MAEILVVDDDENMCSAFRHFLTQEGHKPLIVSNAQDAVRTVAEKHPDLVLMDIRMPGTDGLEALARIREIEPDAFVVIMTAYGTSQTSIEAMRLGAFDYMTKPLDLDEVGDVITRALDAKRLREKIRGAHQEEWEKYSLVTLAGSSPQMQEVYKLVGVLAANDVPALITGEAGTGKQLVAHTIHTNSARKKQPFEVINCRILPELQLTGELFGENAEARPSGASVYLDRIEDLPLALQSRLAAFLAKKSQTRILAGTEADLEELSRAGRFRAELYEAIRLISVPLPPLRQRLGDIPEIVRHLIKKYNDELHRNVQGVDERVMEKLSTHNWPGNISELEHVIKRAFILARGEVLTLDDIGDSLEHSPLLSAVNAEDLLESSIRKVLGQRLTQGEVSADWSPFHDIVNKVEEMLVREALAITGGNQVKAAEILGLNRTTLRKKLGGG